MSKLKYKDGSVWKDLAPSQKEFDDFKTSTVSQLAEKATKTELNDIGVSQINKNKGKFDQTYMTPEFLQQITGTTPVNATPARESVIRGQLTKNSITPELLAFAEKPNNMFNVVDVTKGYTISSSTGALSANASFAVTDFVYIKPNQAYIMRDISRYALYDQAGTFISSAITSTFTTPTNAYFARFVSGLGTLNTAQVNEGSTLLAYDSFEFSLKTTNKTPINIIPSPKSIDENAIKEKSVNPAQTTFLVASNNLFNKNDVQLNKSVDLNGVIIDEAGRVLSDYISVEPNVAYGKSLDVAFRVAMYDRQKNFIKRVITNSGEGTFLTAIGCHYIRISPVDTTAATLMLNKGTTVLPYEDYKFTLRSTIKNPITIDSALIPAGTGEGGTGGSASDLGEQFIYNDSSSYAIGQVKTICDVALKGIVDIIEFSTNSLDAELQIYYKTSGGAEFLYDLVTNDGSTSVPCTMSNLQLYGSAIIEFVDFDDRNNVYKVYVKPLTMANGFKVATKNNSTTVAVTITTRVVSRQYA